MLTGRMWTSELGQEMQLEELGNVLVMRLCYSKGGNGLDMLLSRLVQQRK